MTALEVAAAFLSMFALDFVFGRYTIHCVDRSPLLAAAYASGIAVFAAINVIIYTSNNWMIIPTVAGAFGGTYMAIRGTR